MQSQKLRLCIEFNSRFPYEETRPREAKSHGEGHNFD